MGGLGTMVLRPSGLLGLRTRDRPRTKSQLLRGPSQYLPSSPRGQRGRPSRSHQTIRCSGQALSRSRSGVVAAVPLQLLWGTHVFIRSSPAQPPDCCRGAGGAGTRSIRQLRRQRRNAYARTQRRHGRPQAGRSHRRDQRLPALVQGHQQRPRCELCLDPGDANCIMGDLPNPGQPVSFPDNFPDEAFWSVADSTIDAGGGDKALLVTATEAAFGTADGLPAKGGQITLRPDPDPCRRTGRRCGLQGHAPVRRGARSRPRPAR